MTPIYRSIDFETQAIPFFDKKKTRNLDWSGHPRLAKATHMSVAEQTNAFVCKNLDVIPLSQTIIFHNATFDIQVGLNSGVWSIDSVS